MDGKEYLQGLKLEWMTIDNADEKIQGDEMSLEFLKPPPNIKAFSICGYGGVKFASWMTNNRSSFLLRNIVKIVIENCSNCLDLPPFHQLPGLKVLKLQGLHVVEYIDNNCGESSCSSVAAFFPSLKVLEIFFLPNLKGWKREVAKANEEHHEQQLYQLSFLHLSELKVLRCPLLTSMPSHPSLEKLKLYEVSEKLLWWMTMSSSSLPTNDRLSRLRSMEISSIEDLFAIPEEWSCDLNALERLVIRNCPNLLNLSGEGFRGLTSLLYLEFLRVTALHHCLNEWAYDISRPLRFWRFLNVQTLICWTVMKINFKALEAYVL